MMIKQAEDERIKKGIDKGGAIEDNNTNPSNDNREKK